MKARSVNIYSPEHKFLVLIARKSREGSNVPVHLYSLARAFAAYIHRVWKWMKALTKIRLVAPLDSSAFMSEEQLYSTTTTVKPVLS